MASGAAETWTEMMEIAIRRLVAHLNARDMTPAPAKLQIEVLENMYVNLNST
jgi:hypothetical protein